MVVVGEKRNLNLIEIAVMNDKVMFHAVVDTGQFCNFIFDKRFNSILFLRNNSEKSASQKFENVGGIIKLPPNVNVNTTDNMSLSLSGYLNKTVTNSASQSPHPSKQLFNPNNPNKPIVISPKQQNVRAGYTPANTESHHSKDHYPININSINTQQYSGAHFGNPPPAWYDPYSERYCNKIFILYCLVLLLLKLVQ